MSENVNVRMSRCWTRASRAERPLGHTDQHEYEYFYIYLTWLEYGLQGVVFFVFHLITNENIQLKKKKEKTVTFAAFRKQSTTTLTADIDALVGSVLAVGLSVTMPSLRHTLAVLTHKVWGRTSLCHCRRTKGETWSSVKVKTKPLCSFFFFSLTFKQHLCEKREERRRVRCV